MSQSQVKQKEISDQKDKIGSLFSQETFTQTRAQQVYPEDASQVISQEILCGLAIEAVEEDQANQQQVLIKKEDAQGSPQIAQNAQNNFQNITPGPGNTGNITHAKALSNDRVSVDKNISDIEGEDGVEDEMMDKISSSPSIEDEDINFEFVYALHTFVATIEGQANATKGDTMVLLDDSNSYWWLVRVVKDSSIGYLPAEHIETPTERLARLNKHRNIDLTSAMLGDPTERPKNTMKIAFRKKNMKTVTFSDPTYVEASDVDYSTEEEVDEIHPYQSQVMTHDLSYDHQENIDDEDDPEVVEPLRTRPEVRRVGATDQDPSLLTNEPGHLRVIDDPLNGKSENKSRNGVLRNTDSFFQDDSVETRKITLTPNLLRDDSSASTVRVSNDSKELSRSSLDKLEKDSPDRGKEKKERKEKKEKDKKSGMLSGLFKRKDRKNKSVDEDIDEILGIKQPNEMSRNSPSLSKESDEIITTEEKSPVLSPGNQKQFDQTEKHTRPTSNTSKNLTQVREPMNVDFESITVVRDRAPTNDAASKSLRIVQPENTAERFKRYIQSPSPGSPKSLDLTSPNAEKVISKVITPEISAEASTVMAKNTKSSMGADIYSSQASQPLDLSNPLLAKASQRHALVISPEAIEIPPTDRPVQVEERLSESPVHVSVVDDLQSYPPALLADSSSQDGPLSSESSSPELIYAEDATTKTSSRNSTTTESTTKWNDTHLRTFFDDDADIKDLLIVVYDKSGVEPAGPGHPMIRNLFKEENLRLADMKNRLDCLLGDWLARKLRNHNEG